MSMESPGFANQASSYAAEQTRRAVFSAYARTSANSPGIVAGGLLSTSDMQLSAPASGLSVNVSTGEAIVGGTEGGAQGAYYARCSSTTNLILSGADPTNPRIDTACLTIADTGYTEPSGVSGDAATLQIVTGTPTAGATLSNLDGVAALPKSSLLLGYVLVPAGASNIVSGDIANKATLVVPQAALANPQAVMSSQTRAFGTAYQPNAYRPTFVIVNIQIDQSDQTGTVHVLMDASDPPTTAIAVLSQGNTVSSAGVNLGACVSFLVPPAFYYELSEVSAGNSTSITSVYEMTL